MSMSDVTAIILAAGKGTRMGSDLAKVLHPLAGQPMICHVLATCHAAGIRRGVVVVGHQEEGVRAAVADHPPEMAVSCVRQSPQLGTGHAVQVAMPAVTTTRVVVLCGDAPLVEAGLIAQVAECVDQADTPAAVVGARLADPSGYGRMISDDGHRLLAIVEHRDADADQRRIDLVNSGIYAFAAEALRGALAGLRPDNAQGEYYLTDVPRLLVAQGATVGLVVGADGDSILGVNTPQDLAEAKRIYAARHGI